MIIIGDVIQFKSIDRFFVKEKVGIKNNTVRMLDSNERDEFFDKLRYLKTIRITTSDLNEAFDREIQDVSFYGELVIFTWKV